MTSQTKSKTPKVVKTFRVNPALWDRFQRHAEKDGRSPAEILTLLIEAYVREDVKLSWSIKTH